MTEPTRTNPDMRRAYNGTGGTLAKGTIVIRKTTGTANEIIAATAATDAYMGVCENDIADGEYGDVQVGGIAICLAGSSGVTRQDRVMWEAGADCIPCTTGNAILGVALTTAASGEFFECELVSGGGGPAMP